MKEYSPGVRSCSNNFIWRVCAPQIVDAVLLWARADVSRTSVVARCGVGVTCALLNTLDQYTTDAGEPVPAFLICLRPIEKNAQRDLWAGILLQLGIARGLRATEEALYASILSLLREIGSSNRPRRFVIFFDNAQTLSNATLKRIEFLQYDLQRLSYSPLFVFVRSAHPEKIVVASNRSHLGGVSSQRWVWGLRSREEIQSTLADIVASGDCEEDLLCMPPEFRELQLQDYAPVLWREYTTLTSDHEWPFRDLLITLRNLFEDWKQHETDPLVSRVQRAIRLSGVVSVDCEDAASAHAGFFDEA